MLLNFYFQAHTQENLGLEMRWGAHLHSQLWRPSQNIVTALVPQGPGTAKACCVPVLLGFIKNRSNRTFKIYSPSWGKHSLHQAAQNGWIAPCGYLSSVTSLVWQRFKAPFLPQRYIFLTVLWWKQPFFSTVTSYLCIQDLRCSPGR